MPSGPLGIAAPRPFSARFRGAWAVTDLLPGDQLDGFISRYSPEIASLTRSLLAKMRASLPGAVELVYDNYNALVIGFSASERSSAAVFSIAVYPRWVNLFFLRGARLPDPGRLLKGSGKSVRHINLNTANILDSPAVRTLMAHALSRAPEPFDPTQPNRIVIKSISTRQRLRRPR